MKRKSGLWVFLLASSICILSLAACSGDDSGSKESSQSSVSSSTSSETQESSEAESSTEESEEVSEAADVIGRVITEGESSLDLNVFETEEAVEDYTLLDISTLMDTGETTTVTVAEDAVFYSVNSGELVEISKDTLVMTDLMIAVTENENGVQEIIILESGEVTENTVAEITNIAEDGTLELTLYELSEEAGEYSIEDYADVDFTNYAATEETQEYVVESTVLIYVAADGTLTEADSSAFAVGDMVIIYSGEEDAETITIYHVEG